MFGRLDGDRVRAGRLAPGWALILLLLGGCGGGGSADTPGDGVGGGDAMSVLLFRDGFEDETASAERWTPSQPVFHIDALTGTMPLTNGAVTTNAPPFERAGGELDLLVAMAWPTWCPTTGSQTSRPMQLVELDSGVVVASLVVTMYPDCAALVEYRIDPTGNITPSSVVNPKSREPLEFADGYHHYRIVLLDDGRATWYRDGVAMIASFVPLSDRGYALRLQGTGAEGAPPVLFDEVEVVQR